MAYLSLYNDAECTELLGTAIIGQYDYLQGYYSSTYASYEYTFEEEEEPVKITVLSIFTLSTIKQLPAANEILLYPTATSEIRYIYFNPNFRLKYDYYGTGFEKYYCFSHFEYLFPNTGQWVQLTSEGFSAYSNTYGNNNLRITIRASKTARKQDWWGSFYPIEDSDFLGIDVTYFDQQGREINDRAWLAISKASILLQQRDSEPYTPDTGNVAKAGTGTGYYPNSEIPPLPTNAINNAFSNILGRGNGLTFYELTGDSLVKVTEKLYNNNFVLSSTRQDSYRDAVASVVLVPVSIPANHKVSNTLNIIYLSNTSITPSSGTSDIVVKPLVEIDFGYVDLVEDRIGFGNYADYIYTNAVLYLPCIGNIELDMSMITKGFLHVIGVVDVRNGNIVYRVETRSEKDDAYVLLGHYNGNCGLNVPIGGASAPIDMSSILSSAAMIGVGVATKSLPMVASSGISGIKESFANALYPHVSTAGALRPVGACLTTPVPILQIQKHILLSPPDWTNLMGVASGGSNPNDSGVFPNKLSDYKGFVRCKNADISNIDHLNDEEKDELLRLLKEGVFV